MVCHPLADERNSPSLGAGCSLAAWSTSVMMASLRRSPLRPMGQLDAPEVFAQQTLDPPQERERVTGSSLATPHSDTRPIPRNLRVHLAVWHVGRLRPRSSAGEYPGARLMKGPGQLLLLLLLSA